MQLHWDLGFKVLTKCLAVKLCLRQPCRSNKETEGRRRGDLWVNENGLWLTSIFLSLYPCLFLSLSKGTAFLIRGRVIRSNHSFYQCLKLTSLINVCDGIQKGRWNQFKTWLLLTLICQTRTPSHCQDVKPATPSDWSWAQLTETRIKLLITECGYLQYYHGLFSYFIFIWRRGVCSSYWA